MIQLIFLIAFVIRLFFASPWLEDWDSVQFAYALDEFSIIKHQPHPPGYPLFIVLGRILNSYFQNPTLSLTFLSALMGALSVIPFYILAKKLADKKTAVYASIIFISLPVHFILSEVPISNITGLFFILVSALLIYSEVISSKRLSMAGILSGFFLGVRPTDLPIIAGLLAFLFLKKKDVKYRLSIIFGFMAGVFIWLIPLILITGISGFRQVNSETSRYFIWHDMLFGKEFSLWTYSYDRLTNLLRLFNIGYTPLFFTVCIISTLFIIKRNVFKNNTGKQFLFVYLFSYGIPLIFIYNLELAQYTLPLSIVFSIFSVVFLKNIFPKRIFILIYILLTVFLFKTSFDTIKYQLSTIPPTIGPVFYVKENYKAQDVVLITTYTYRQFQYYAGEFKNYYGKSNAPKVIESKYVIIDYEGLAREIQPLSEYQVIDELHFGPSKNKFVRLNSTNLYILKKKLL